MAVVATLCTPHARLDQTPQDMRAVVTVGGRGVGELLKPVGLREHLGCLPQHLSLYQDLDGGALVDGAAVRPGEMINKVRPSKSQ